MVEPLNPYASPPVSDLESVGHASLSRRGTAHQNLALQFEVQRDDFVALLQYLALQSPFARRRLQRRHVGCGLAILLGTLALLLLPAVRLWQFRGVAAPADLWRTFPLALVVLTLVLVRMAAGQQAARRQITRYADQILHAGQNRLALGPQALDLDADGIHHRSQYHQSHIQWAALESIGIAGNHVVLMWSPAAGLIIPGRALVHESERVDLIATCLKYAPEARVERAMG